MGLKKPLKKYLNLHTSRIHCLIFTTLQGDEKEKQKMHLFNHNSRPSAQSNREDDEERPGYFPSAPCQLNTAAIGDLPNQPVWSSGPNGPESLYEAADFTPSLPSIPYSSGYIYSGWSADQQFPIVAPPGRMAAVPEWHDMYGWGATFGRGAEEVPLSDPVFPYGSTAMSSNIPPTPFLSWPSPPPGPSLHPSTSWRSSSSTANQYTNHNASSGAFPRSSAIFPSQSGIIHTGPGNKPMPTGLPSSYSITGAVQPSIGAQPVPVTRVPPLRSFDDRLQESSSATPACAAPTWGTRGERWDQPEPPSFRCMCRNSDALCRAQIIGERSSVTNHLRDEHNFTCDDQKIMCPWDDCEAKMQRRNIPRHIVSCHLAVKVCCSDCGLPLSRKDAEKKHRQACPGPHTSHERGDRSG